MNTAFEAGRLLAVRHRDAAHAASSQPLIDFSERFRPPGWSFRSGLVRFAQPEPLRASIIVEFIRRAEAALKATGPVLTTGITVCDRDLATLPEPGEPDHTPGPGRHNDARSTDIARLVTPQWAAVEAKADTGRTAPGGRAGVPPLGAISIDDVVDGYRQVLPLDEDEVAAIPVLGAAVALDRFGDDVAEWAATAPSPAPVDKWDDRCRVLRDHFEQLGIAAETRPPGGERRRR